MITILNGGCVALLRWLPKDVVVVAGLIDSDWNESMTHLEKVAIDILPTVENKLETNLLGSIGRFRTLVVCKDFLSLVIIHGADKHDLYGVFLD